MLESISRGRARIGVLVPFTNVNLEADMTLLCPHGVSAHFARLGGYDADEVPDADQMAGLGSSDLDEPLRLLTGAAPDVILYGCTSASLTHGPAFDLDLAEKIRGMSGADTVTAAGALVFALNTLQLKNVAFASPYVAKINEAAIAFLTECGFDVVSAAAVETELDNKGQREFPTEKIVELGLKADSDEAEALILSCTDMRAVEVIDNLEKRIKKPVITSNQAMMFQALRTLGIDRAPVGYGALFERL